MKTPEWLKEFVLSKQSRSDIAAWKEKATESIPWTIIGVKYGYEIFKSILMVVSFRIFQVFHVGMLTILMSIPMTIGLLLGMLVTIGYFLLTLRIWVPDVIYNGSADSLIGFLMDRYALLMFDYKCWADIPDEPLDY